MTSFITRYGLLALLASPTTALAQAPNYLARVQQLGLDSLAGRVPTYYSSGARERAVALQQMLDKALVYFNDRTGVAAKLAVAVLNEADWAHVRSLPYGIPWVSYSPYLAVLPAELERSVIVRGFADVRQRASPATRRALEDAGLTWQ